MIPIRRVDGQISRTLILAYLLAVLSAVELIWPQLESVMSPRLAAIAHLALAVALALLRLDTRQPIEGRR